MQGAKDLLQSERGVFCIGALLMATLLTFLKVIDGLMWLDFVKWLTTALVASKTVTSAVETYTAKKSPIPEARIVDDGKE